jgi:hypothetical protein
MGLTTTGDSPSTVEWLCWLSHSFNRSQIRLWPTVSRRVCLGFELQLGPKTRLLLLSVVFWWCGVSSLTKGRVCRLQLLLAFAGAVILGSESCGTHDSILLSEIRHSPNLEGQVLVFISPTNRATQLYSQVLGSPFVASYDSQGYGGGIRTFLVESSLMLRPKVSRPVCLGIKHPCGAYDQIFITVRQLLVYWCRALSLTRGRVCRLQLLLTLARAVILRSESRGTRDHILLSHVRDFPFRRLLRLSGLRWRYSTCPRYMYNLNTDNKNPASNISSVVLWYVSRLLPDDVLLVCWPTVD